MKLKFVLIAGIPLFLWVLVAGAYDEKIAFMDESKLSVAILCQEEFAQVAEENFANEAVTGRRCQSDMEAYTAEIWAADFKSFAVVNSIDFVAGCEEIGRAAPENI